MNDYCSHGVHWILDSCERRVSDYWLKTHEAFSFRLFFKGTVVPNGMKSEKLQLCFVGLMIFCKEQERRKRNSGGVARCSL